MESAPKQVARPPKTRRQKAQTILSCVVLVTALVLVYKSWRSSQTLAFSFSGTWISTHGNFTAECVGGDWYASNCRISAPYAFEGEVLVAPLADGSWAWKLPREGAPPYFFHHSRGSLRVMEGEQRGRGAKPNMSVFSRAKESNDGTFWTVAKAKSQYIVPLFVLVMSYKWVQAAVFGSGRASATKRQRLIGPRRTAGSR